MTLFGVKQATQLTQPSDESVNSDIANSEHQAHQQNDASVTEEANKHETGDER